MKLVYTELMEHFSLGNPVEVMDGIYNTPILKGRLTERMLLYDQIVIPTGNFGIVPVLRLWFGDKMFVTLLEKRIISFLKYTGWVAYIGNGGGLKFFTIKPGKGQTETLGTTFFTDKETALEIALNNTICPTPCESRDKISKLILDNTEEINLDGEFAKKIRHETYMDIINSPSLRSFLLFKNPGLTEINLDRLEGINPNQVRFYDYHRPYNNQNDDISIVLNIAVHNILFYIISQIDNSDIFSDETSERVLISKLDRVSREDSLTKGVSKILEVNNIPDLSALIANGNIDIQIILSIREHSDALYFRQWLQNNSYENSTDVIKAYISAITKVSKYDSFPARVIRFVALDLLGLAAGIPGLIASKSASAIDSFIISDLLSRKNPKIFIDNLMKVICSPKKQS